MNSVTGLAVEFLSGLYNANTNTVAIERWVRDNIGRLNVALYGNFALSGAGDAQLITGESPSWDSRVGDIYEKMHELTYYKHQIMATLPAGTSNHVTEVNSDGGRIKMANPIEIAKQYRSLQKETEEELAVLVANFNLARSSARQVAGDDIFQSYNSTDNYNRT